MDNLSRENKVEFVLDSIEQGQLVLNTDPPNWDDDEKTYQLDKDSLGVLRKINTALEITKEGYDYLYGSTLAYGLSPEISITKNGKDTLDKHEEWRQFYHAYLDMPKAEIDIDRKVVKVPFTQGGLYDRIKSRYTNKYDLVNTKDADGNDIGELKTITEQVTGRQIFRRSVAAIEDGTKIQHVVSGGDNKVVKAVVFKVNPNSDKDNINDVIPGTESLGFSGGSYQAAEVGALLFTRSDRTRKRTLNGKVRFKIVDSDIGQVSFDAVRYKYNTATQTYDFLKIDEVLQLWDTNNLNGFYEHDFNDYELELGQDEAWTLAMNSFTDDGWGYEYYDTNVVISEDDSFPATTAKNLLPFELIDRCLEKITGESGLLISNVLGRGDLGYENDGQWSLLSTSSGFWARGFDDKQFSISFKDVLQSINAVFPIMWTIENRMGIEYLRLEKYEYTQQSFIGVQMGRQTLSGFTYIPASKPVLSFLSDNLYTGVKMGYEKGGGNYEEVFGLRSPHGTAEYNTSYRSNEETIYTKISKIRADVEGFELARVKQATSFPDEDTPYDQDIFFRHLKKVATQYFLRAWQDDFDEAPQGEDVYSPDTMGNLLLTPLRCLLRHKGIIATSIYKQPFETLNWISSNCFSEFSTTKTGETEISENGGILNQDLGSPFISEYLLKFDGKVFQEMVDQLEGTTTINGEEIPNWYGIYEVKVNNQLRKGKLIKVQITGEGKHEIALLP